ncbi:MAG: GNAT family N-acetyltransferase [Alphaproteobacteria bacterium]
MQVRVFDSLDALTPPYGDLFDRAGARSFYLSLPWFRNLAATTLGAGETLRLYGVENDGRAEALLVARTGGSGGPLTPRTLAGFTNAYTILFAPLVRDEAAPGPALAALAEALAAERPAWDLVHLDGLDRDEPLFAALADAFRRAGFLVHAYFHFGNAYQSVSDGYDAYIRSLPGQTRSNIKRGGKRLAKDHEARLEIVTDVGGLSRAFAAYDAIYAASWKEPEPFPDFTPGLAHACAEAGSLRLGLLHVDGWPAAAQLWIVAAGKATIYKLAYDEEFKRFSVGTILTDHVLRHVIEADQVREIDFGRGDDPYKSSWLAERRERWGLMAFNPRTPRGLLAAARHKAAPALKGWLAKRVRQTRGSEN